MNRSAGPDRQPAIHRRQHPVAEGRDGPASIRLAGEFHTRLTELLQPYAAPPEPPAKTVPINAKQAGRQR